MSGVVFMQSLLKVKCKRKHEWILAMLVARLLFVTQGELKPWATRSLLLVAKK